MQSYAGSKVRTRVRRAVSELTFVALIGALAGSGAAFAADGPTGTSRQGLSVNVGKKWTTPFIAVCWETSAWPEQRRWVKEAAERTWMAESRIVFSGWGQCAADTKGIRISVENGPFPPGMDASTSVYGWPRSDIGQDGQGVSRMWLTFDFVAQAADFRGCGSGPGNRRCIESIAVHEFGHALGFPHEQDRGDVPVSCVSQMKQDYPGTGLGSAVQLGPFDQTSIMAYCNPAWNNNGELSPNDVFYLQQFYGRKAAGSIVAFDGRCLDTAGGTGNSALIQTYECLGGTHFAPGDLASGNQRWFYAPGGSFTLAGTRRVLDVPRNDSTTGNRLQLFDYLGAPGQQWAMPRARVRSMGGMCLRPLNLPASSGTELALFRCDPRASHPDLNFELRADGTLRHEASGMCAEPNGGAAGARVVLRPCTGAPAQKHLLTAAGSITTGGGQCLDIGVPGANLNKFFGVDGHNRLQIWACNGAANQKFSLAGTIVGLAGKCVDVAAFGRQNGTAVQLWDCNGHHNQHFEVHW